MSIAIRALHPDDWQAFRAVRLNALQTEPGVYATSFAEASERTEQDWRDLIAGPHHQVFGLFDSDTLVGITAIFRDRDDPSGETALLAMSFIAAAYRGRGFSKLFYDARLAWARAYGGLKRVIVSHRASNTASMRANQRYGFVRTGVAVKLWPDGLSEDEVHYELLL